MKVAASLAAFLLASVAMARPRGMRAMEEGDSLPQKSRVSAFVVDADGKPSIECWEITNMVEDQQTYQVKGAGGVKSRGYVTPLAGRSELRGLDIITWPTSSRIWPRPQDTKGDVHSEWLDLHSTFNLFTIQGGLINFNPTFRFGKADDDDDDWDNNHVFALENGDDWFYFEDNTSYEDYSGKEDEKPYPFEMNTISATETEVLRLKFDKQPKHKVLHKGSCSFTGIRTPDDSSSGKAQMSRAQSPLTVQVNVGEL